MRRKRDFYTNLLPFEDEETIGKEIDFNGANKQTENLLGVLKERLMCYLNSEKQLPKNLPLLKLLPSLNKIVSKDKIKKFNEDEASTLLKELGVIIEPNPSYLGRSRYRVTISKDTAENILGKAVK